MRTVKAMLLTLLPFSVFSGLYSSGERIAPTLSVEAQRERLTTINDLAATASDITATRKLVGMTFSLLAPEAPDRWTDPVLCERLAEAEFLSITTRGGLISEERVATAWNNYAKVINLPSADIVTSAEIHSLREGSKAASDFLWNRGNRSLWTLPNIYALDSNGRLASGCRVLETLRILWDLNVHIENLEGARQRLNAKAPTPSAQLSTPSGRIPGAMMLQSALQQESTTQIAEKAFVRMNGDKALHNAKEEMLNDVLKN